MWTIFYGESTYGPIVLAIMVLSAIFANLYSVTFNTMQSLNKFKTVYISIIVGFGLNAILDIPLIVLFNKIGLPPYWGATVATVTGYLVSIKIATRDLKKNHKMSFASTYKMAAKILVPTTIMVLALNLVNYFFRLDLSSTLNCLIVIVVNAVIGGTIYLGIAYKMGIIEEVFGKSYLNKIIKKLTFGKVSIGN